MKPLISASVLSFVAVQTLFASQVPAFMPNLPSLLKSKTAHVTATKPSMPAKAAHALSYTDFSGKWIGQCEEGQDGQPYEMELNIESVDQGIIVNGMFLDPQEITGQSLSNQEGQQNTLITVEWVDSNQALLLKVGGMGFERKESGYDMATYSMTAKWSLDAGQLKQEGSFEYLVQGQKGQGSMNCIFKKQ